ncbi:MAG: chlorite dismutase family protein [Actinomycetota bacterium]
MSEDRKVMRYVFYQIDPQWRHLPHEERVLHKKEFAEALADSPVEVHSYSTVGLRADSEIALWQLSDSAESIQQLQARLNGTRLGAWLRTTYSYLATTKKSQYLKGHTHEGQEFDLPAGPVGKSYLFVYPLDKQRRWYSLAYEERRRIMGGHFKVGHRYPDISIHTGYSFGIDDQEFVVAFEGESIGEFLDLVQELRESESSAYTSRDVPIFTCIKMPIEDVLDQLGGVK